MTQEKVERPSPPGAHSSNPSLPSCLLIDAKALLQKGHARLFCCKQTRHVRFPNLRSDSHSSFQASHSTCRCLTFVRDDSTRPVLATETVAPSLTRERRLASGNCSRGEAFEPHLDSSRVQAKKYPPSEHKDAAFTPTSSRRGELRRRHFVSSRSRSQGESNLNSNGAASHNKDLIIKQENHDTYGEDAVTTSEVSSQPVRLCRRLSLLFSHPQRKGWPG